MFRVGYRFDDGWTVQLDALNMLNAKTNQITYSGCTVGGMTTWPVVNTSVIMVPSAILNLRGLISPDGSQPNTVAPRRPRYLERRLSPEGQSGSVDRG